MENLPAEIFYEICFRLPWKSVINLAIASGLPIPSPRQYYKRALAYSLDKIKSQYIIITKMKMPNSKSETDVSIVFRDDCLLYYWFECDIENDLYNYKHDKLKVVDYKTGKVKTYCHSKTFILDRVFQRYSVIEN